MDLHRIWLLIKKDMAWIKGDFKLLGNVSVLPIFIILIFSTISRVPQLKEENNLSTIIDVNIFGILILIFNIALITTSQLILQEKAKGTLHCLLITPLKYQEFILGKLFFTFSLSLLFATLLALTSGMKDIVLNPIVLLNLALFIGTMCFIGCIVGVFSDTVLENSSIVFFVLVFYIISVFILKSIAKPVFKVLYFIHPSSHFFEVFSDSKNLLIHTGFNLLFFIGFFAFCVFYIRFYFSNNREKRISLPLLLSLCAGVIVMLILSILLFLTGQYKLAL